MRLLYTLPIFALFTLSLPHHTSASPTPPIERSRFLRIASSIACTVTTHGSGSYDTARERANEAILRKEKISRTQYLQAYTYFFQNDHRISNDLQRITAQCARFNPKHRAISLQHTLPDKTQYTLSLDLINPTRSSIHYTLPTPPRKTTSKTTRTSRRRNRCAPVQALIPYTLYGFSSPFIDLICIKSDTESTHIQLHVHGDTLRGTIRIQRPNGTTVMWNVSESLSSKNAPKTKPQLDIF